jgi:hypothetical protein
MDDDVDAPLSVLLQETGVHAIPIRVSLVLNGSTTIVDVILPRS